MCLAGFLLPELERLVHAQRCVATRHRLLLLLLRNLLQPLLRLSLSRTLTVEPVAERFPRLLGCQLPPKLVMIHNVDVWFVVPEMFQAVACLVLFPQPILILARRLVLVRPTRLDAVKLSLCYSPPLFREP